MDRRSIVRASLAGIAMQGNAAAQQERAPYLVRAGDERFGETTTVVPCKLSSKDTNGALSIFGGDRRGPGSVPLHVHHRQDEWWYIVEGEHLFQIGDRKIRAKAGDSVFGPRGIPHSPRQLSKYGVVITVFQPAGSMEEFFREVAQARQKSGEVPFSEVVAALFRQHGMDIVGPPVQP